MVQVPATLVVEQASARAGVQGVERPLIDRIVEPAVGSVRRLYGHPTYRRAGPLSVGEEVLNALRTRFGVDASCRPRIGAVITKRRLSATSAKSTPTTPVGTRSIMSDRAQYRITVWASRRRLATAGMGIALSRYVPTANCNYPPSTCVTSADHVLPGSNLSVFFCTSVCSHINNARGVARNLD